MGYRPMDGAWLDVAKDSGLDFGGRRDLYDVPVLLPQEALLDGVTSPR